MSDLVYLNAKRTKVVDRFAPGKKWQIDRKEAVRLGLLPADSKPQERRVVYLPPAEKVAPRVKRKYTKRKP